MVRMWSGLVWAMIEQQRSVVYEKPATCPAVPFWPQRKRGQEGRPADCRPGISVKLVLHSASVDFTGEINQQVAVWRKIAPPFVDPAFEPLAVLKLIRVGVPEDESHPIGWPTPEDHCARRTPREDGVESAGWMWNWCVRHQRRRSRKNSVP